MAKWCYLAAMTGEKAYSARLRIPSLPLVKGEFALYVFLLDESGLHIYDQRVIPSAFNVRSPAYAFGLVHVRMVEARRAYLNEHLAGLRRGLGNVRHHEAVFFPGIFDSDGFHLVFPACADVFPVGD